MNIDFTPVRTKLCIVVVSLIAAVSFSMTVHVSKAQAASEVDIQVMLTQIEQLVKIVQALQARLDAMNEAPALIYKTEEYSVTFPGRTVAETRTMDVPYMQYSDEDHRIFEEQGGMRIDFESWSPSRQYIYFSYGVGKDASVIPYLFDVDERDLRKMCYGEICTPASGFASQDHIQVEWIDQNQLEVVYDNPSVPENGSEYESIGEQVFRSVINTPWMLIQHYEY